MAGHRLGLDAASCLCSSPRTAPFETGVWSTTFGLRLVVVQVVVAVVVVDAEAVLVVVVVVDVDGVPAEAVPEPTRPTPTLVGGLPGGSNKPLRPPRSCHPTMRLRWHVPPAGPRHRHHLLSVVLPPMCLVQAPAPPSTRRLRSRQLKRWWRRSR